MTNGVEIRLEEFKRMDKSDQMATIFENTECVKKNMEKYRFHQKVQYTLIGFLTSAMAFISTRLFK